MSDPFDDRLRSKLSESIDPSAGAHSVLHGLTPALGRARRTAQVRTGVTGLVAVLATVGLSAAVFTDTDRQDTVVAVTPTEVWASSSTSVTTGVESSTVDTPTVSDSEDAPSTSAGADSTTSPTSSATVVTTVDARSSLPPTSATSASSTPTSTAPGASTSSTQAPATTQGPGSTLVESACGYIEVATSGPNITLIDVVADPGFEIDEKDDGPESVEVSFEGPSGHCELRAEVRNGVLWTDVSSE